MPPDHPSPRAFSRPRGLAPRLLVSTPLVSGLLVSGLLPILASTPAAAQLPAGWFGAPTAPAGRIAEEAAETPQPAATPAPLAPGEEPPVMISAERMINDDELETVTAIGSVELIHGDRILLADRLVFNRGTEIVTASGNVVLVEPTGEVYFGDSVNLTEDLGEGFVRNARGLLGPDIRFAGVRGERLEDGRFLRLERGVYSPCQLCEEDPDSPPIWQIRADRVIHDSQTRDVIYNDATLEIGGVPVAYTPYLTHPDPTVRRRSGILAPSFSYNSTLGVQTRLRYYQDVAPDLDFTYTAGLYTEQYPLLGLEVRKRFEDGELIAFGTGTWSDRYAIEDPEDPRVDLKGGRNLRGHLAARGLFELDDQWRTGGEIRRTTDDDYLLQYDLPYESVLTSRLYAEGFHGSDYTLAEVLDFQDIRPGVPLEQQARVLPLVRHTLLTEPGAVAGGRGRLEAGLVGLQRSRGGDMVRLSSEGEWESRLIGPAGLVADLGARLRGDLYWLDDQPAGPGRRGDPEVEARIFPQGWARVGWPLSRVWGQGSAIIEPQIGLVAAPRTLGGSEIPNEDSRDIEIDALNLFTPNRFVGDDRQEGGMRVDYGVSSGVYADSGAFATLFLGQSFRLTESLDFPTGTGLENRRSDYVGALQLAPAPWLDLEYRLRLSSDSFEHRLSSARFSAGTALFNLSGTWIYSDAIEDNNVGSLNQVLLGVASNFGTRYYSASAYATRNLGANGGFVNVGTALTYADDCFLISLVGTRDLTTQRAGVDDTSVFLRFVFLGLGEFQTADLIGGLDLFGGAQEGEGEEADE